jgi:hypothetical protein
MEFRIRRNGSINAPYALVCITDKGYSFYQLYILKKVIIKQDKL